MLASHWQSDIRSCVYDSYGEPVSYNERDDKWRAGSLKAMQGATDEWSLTLQSHNVEYICNDFIVEQGVDSDIGVLILTTGRSQARSPAGAGAASGGGATASSRERGPGRGAPGRGAPGQRPLTDAEEVEVAAALSHRTRDTSEVLVEFHNIPVTRESMCTLQPSAWLNDEVINVFFKLLLAREEGGGKHADLPTCHFMQTNFYPKLAEQRGKGYCYKGVKRWTKQTDIFTKHLVIVPIHCHGNHWTLAVVNVNEGRFEYYDSLYRLPGMVLVNLVTEAGLDRTPLAGCMGPLPPHGPYVTSHGHPASVSAAGLRTSTWRRRRRCSTPQGGLRLCGSVASRRCRRMAVTAASS